MKIALTQEEVAIAVSNFINKQFNYDDGMGRHYLAQPNDITFDRYLGRESEFAIFESQKPIEEE